MLSSEPKLISVPYKGSYEFICVAVVLIWWGKLPFRFLLAHGESEQACVLAQAFPGTGHIILGQCLNVSKPHFPYLYKRKDYSTCFMYWYQDSMK